MVKNENKKPKTIFTVYNIESGEEYTFTNFDEWARSVGENTNTRSRFNDMCKSTTVQYRGKYILKDEKFNERLENAKSGKVKGKTSEMKDQMSLIQRKDYHKNKTFVKIDEKFSIVEEYNTDNISNLKKFAEDNNVDRNSFLLMLRDGDGCRKLKRCGSFMLKITYQNELEGTLKKVEVEEKESDQKTDRKKPVFSSVKKRDSVLNMYKLTNLTTKESLLTKDHSLTEIAQIFSCGYSAIFMFLKSDVSTKTKNKNGEIIIKEKV